MADNNSPWEYKSNDDSATAVADHEQPAAEAALSPRSGSGGSISWAASEYIEHQRDATWYLVLIFGTFGLAVGVYALTNHDYIATATIVIVGMIVAVFSTHRPKEITYTLDDSGLTAGQKVYDYKAFKSFSVIHDGALNSVNLLPIKRFTPPIAAYYSPADEEKIIDIIGNHLPYEERDLDAVDKLTRRLRF